MRKGRELVRGVGKETGRDRESNGVNEDSRKERESKRETWKEGEMSGIRKEGKEERTKEKSERS